FQLVILYPADKVATLLADVRSLLVRSIARISQGQVEFTEDVDDGNRLGVAALPQLALKPRREGDHRALLPFSPVASVFVGELVAGNEEQAGYGLMLERG